MSRGWTARAAPGWARAEESAERPQHAPLLDKPLLLVWASPSRASHRAHEAHVPKGAQALLQALCSHMRPLWKSPLRRTPVLQQHGAEVYGQTLQPVELPRACVLLRESLDTSHQPGHLLAQTGAQRRILHQ